MSNFQLYKKAISATGTTTENEPVIKSDGASSNVMQWLSNDGSSNITISEDASNNLDLVVSAGNVGIGTSSPNTYGYGTAVVLTISDPTDHEYNRGILELESTKTTPANGDYLGGIAFISKNNTNGKRCANILARASGSTSAHFGGKLEFQTKADNGAEATALTIASTGLCSFSNGIAFTQTGTAATGAATTSSTLDHYEEGTWTPALKFGGNSASMTYSIQAGAYTKIGNRVLYSFFFVLTAKGSSTGAVTIEGLPFTVPAGYLGYSAMSLRLQNISFADTPSGATVATTTNLDLRETSNAGVQSTLTEINFADDSYVIGSGQYSI